MPLHTVLSSIPFIRWRFVFDGGGGVPASLWRSVFGKTLRESVCVTGQSHCSGCLLRGRCAYPRWFDPTPPHTPAPLGVSDSPPMPYAMSVTQSAETVLDITVFGSAALSDSTLLLAIIERAAKTGVGKLRRSFRLVSADAFLPPEATQFLPDGFHAHPLPRINYTGENQATVVLQSPLRLQVKGKVMTEHNFSAAEFIRALLRRITLLHWAYGSSSLPPVPLSSIEDIHLSSQHLFWQMGERYSARQEKVIPLDGLAGTFTLKGAGLASLLPWLDAGQWFQTGKSTTQGLGQFAINIP